MKIFETCYSYSTDQAGIPKIVQVKTKKFLIFIGRLQHPTH